MLLLIYSSLINAQMLVQNGGFENWTSVLPDNWTLVTSEITHDS